MKAEVNMSNTPKIDVINFVSGITPKSVTNLIEVTGQARNNGSSRILLHISSGGGSLNEAFTAYNYLRSLDVPIETHNIGNVQSAAVMLFLAADIRRADPYSRFLFHPFNWTFNGDIEAPVLRRALNSLDFDAQRYGDIFNERTQRAQAPIDIFECLGGKETIIGAPAAVTAGIVSDISAATVPAGAAMWWII
jgi:ATP-dependent protease ClpP protease subunit